MYGRDLQHRSLAASKRRSRQVDFADPVVTSAPANDGRSPELADKGGPSASADKNRPSATADKNRPSATADKGGPPVLAEGPAAGGEIRSTAEVPLRRRAIGQGVAVAALGAAVWFIVTAGDSAVRSELGSDGPMSSERAALVALLDGVVAQVGVETIEAVGDQTAQFGAGDGPSGPPPAAPSRVGRDQPRPGGSDLGTAAGSPTRGRPGSTEPTEREVDEIAIGHDATAPGGPAILSGPRGSGASAAPTTNALADSLPSAADAGPTTTARRTTARPTTAGPNTTRRTTTTVRPQTTRPATTAAQTIATAAVTTATSAATSTSTTEEPTITIGATTTSSSTTATQPEPTCVVVVTKVVSLKAEPRGNAAIVGEAVPGTYTVLERHGAKWYRIGGGWLRDTGRVTPDC